jgi:hypothetical protein
VRTAQSQPQYPRPASVGARVRRLQEHLVSRSRLWQRQALCFTRCDERAGS